MNTNRKSRPSVDLGIGSETVFAGDHLAYFYETDAEFQNAFGFVEGGLRGGDHCILFGIPADTERMLAMLRQRHWDTALLIADGRLSVLHPEPTCAATVASVARHFGLPVALSNATTPEPFPPTMTTTESPMLQVLREDGTAVTALPAGLTPERLREALRWMKIARVFDGRAIALQRQGKSLTYAGMYGQEAALVGSALTLDPSRVESTPGQGSRFYLELPAHTPQPTDGPRPTQTPR